MKGKDIIGYIVRADMPDREQVLKNCLESTSPKKEYKKAIFTRPRFAVAAVAVLVACFMFFIMPITQEDVTVNIFNLRAYAMERQADGSVVLREVVLPEESLVWGGFLDGNNFFLSIWLRVEGENIQSVDFSTYEGFFAKQYLEFENGEIVIGDMPVLHIGEDYTLAMIGTDFEIIGDSFTLAGSEMPDNMLLFLGITITENQIPAQMTFTATASFVDGTTQEENITISLEDRIGLILVDSADDEIAQRHSNWWLNISLEDAEVVPQSVKIISEVHYGKVYEFQLQGFQIPFIIYGHQLEFDEDGIFWAGFMSDFRVSDQNVYISVIKRDDSGTMTGMVYRLQVDWPEMELQQVDLQEIIVIE